jgi:4-hydroxythreonine-4-phosphate dehydrogenase
MPPIAIACGDHSGIGPEIALKAVSEEVARDHPSIRYVLIGDRGHLQRWNQRLRLGLDLGTDSPEPRVGLVDPRAEPLPEMLAPGDLRAAAAAMDYLRFAAERSLAGGFAALVTAPVCKETIVRAGNAFVGQTEFLAEIAGNPEVTMMLLGDDAQGRWLRVALATTHLPLRRVPEVLTSARIERALRQATDACEELQLGRSRLAVCGLNPHAGEGGVLGDEESRIIAPAIAAARRAGLDVTGPLSADTVFHAALRGDWDVVVAMYHDQGLPPLKTVAFDRGVNWTLGLPFTRTSPDHGTAFDIAGGGKADPSSMRAALRLAVQQGQQRARRVLPPQPVEHPTSS